MQAAALLAASLAMAAQPASGEARTVTVSHSLIRLIDQVMVPAQEAGVLMALDIEAGDVVELDQHIGQIMDIDARVQKAAADLEFQAAKMQAENDASVRAAVATAEVARAEKELSLKVNETKKDAISALEINRLILTEKRAYLQSDVAQMEQQIAIVTKSIREKQSEAAFNAVERRKIKAPLGGIVTGKFRHVGEWVSPGDPVLHIVRMDRLRVEGFLDASEFTPQEIDGCAVTVRVELPHGQVIDPPLTGKIDYVSQVVDDSGEFRIWADIENRSEGGYWVVRPGLPAEMTILLGVRNVDALTSR